MSGVNYEILLAQAEALIRGVPHLVANLSNVSALLFESMDRINWAGFYFREETGSENGGILVLGPFQGRPACIEIPWGKGVCGTAAEKDCTQLVPDVHAFPGHIACDAASRSEIVIPLHGSLGGRYPDLTGQDGSRVIGVLDIDSPEPDRFTVEDREGLEKLARLLEQHLF